MAPKDTDSLTPEDLPPLVTWGDPRLARPSAPVAPADIGTPEFRRRLALLRIGLDAHGANGIAAPQLGWFERYFLMRDPSGSAALVYWINPEVTATTDELLWTWEGCLSVPGYKAYVGRPSAIAVRGLNELGEPVSREFKGWEAHLFQHEFDHLDGVLFPDRVTDMRHIVTAANLERRADWPPDWPAPGAREAPIRAIAKPDTTKPGGQGS